MAACSRRGTTVASQDANDSSGKEADWEGPSKPIRDAAIYPGTRRAPHDCIQFDPVGLTQARPLHLLNANHPALTNGVLALAIEYDRAHLADMTPDAFEALRFTELMPSELAAANFATPPTRLPASLKLGVQVVGVDGAAEFAEIFEYDELAAKVSLMVRAPVRRVSQAFRVVEDGRVLLTVQRPSSPPIIEVRIVQDRPLLLAVRARGHATRIQVSFIDPRTNREYSLLEEILPDTGQEQPCWYAAQTPPELVYEPSAPPLFSLLDLFHRWTYSIPTPEHD